MRLPCGVLEDLVRKQQRNQHSSTRRYLQIGAVLFTVMSISGLSAQNPQSLAETAPHRNAQSRPGANPERSQPKAQPPDLTWLQDAVKDQQLMEEVGKLMEKLQKGVVYPGARNQSRILPRLADSTLFYAALPNYGDTAQQALQIFHQGLNDSPHLRAFLQKNNFDAVQPTIENAVQKIYEVSQFLGDEVVIIGKLQGKEPSGVLVAEIKKPGLRDALEKLNNEIFANRSDRLRIFGPEQLTAAGETDSRAPAVLIRSDYVVFGLSLASLRDFNSQLDERGTTFTSHALGERLARAYQQGTSTLIGLDLHQLIDLIPVTKAQDRTMLEKTGLADVNYLVSESTLSANGSKSQGEITFRGPRRGVASWIGAPVPIGGLDFVSGNAAVAIGMILKSPGLIFDDLRDIMGEGPFASVRQMETGLNLNLKRDLLSKLTGEIVFEAESPALFTPALPVSSAALAPKTTPKTGPFKIILGVSDTQGVQQTLTQLLTTASMQTAERQEEGITVHTVMVPGAAGDAQEINYFFLDGYLVIASDYSMAEEALRAHRAGTSLAKSAKFREAMGRGQSSALKASMVFYQNAGQMMAPLLAQLPPELRQLIGARAIETPPSLFFVTADETSLHGFTTNNAHSDLTVGMIVAAIAIPSLMKARVAADDSFATSAIRTVNTAQVKYSGSYPDRGYASGLSLLGPGPAGDCTRIDPTAEHACLLDNVLASPDCSAGKWCEKSGYKFSVRGVCLMGKCLSYVVSATPAAGAAGRNFCSTEDAVIRAHFGPALTAPLTAAECKTWMPVR